MNNIVHRLFSLLWWRSLLESPITSCWHIHQSLPDIIHRYPLDQPMFFRSTTQRLTTSTYPAPQCPLSQSPTQLVIELNLFMNPLNNMATKLCIECWFRPIFALFCDIKELCIHKSSCINSFLCIWINSEVIKVIWHQSNIKRKSVFFPWKLSHYKLQIYFHHIIIITRLWLLIQYHLIK